MKRKEFEEIEDLARSIFIAKVAALDWKDEEKVPIEVSSGDFADKSFQIAERFIGARDQRKSKAEPKIHVDGNKV